ncbi:MAG: TonB-dependent receptor plug domain-containing protein [Bacteroidia bacterium]|nr:TonB-dependent receptor plug domain-containing protein [Bacteroidia bacterium]
MCLSLSVSVMGQIDSVVLKQTILTPRGKTRVAVLDSLEEFQGETIAEALVQRGLAFVRLPAAGGLTTVSVRGGNSEQTTFFWNGISIQNTLNGSLDLNLLPSDAFDRVELNSVNSGNTGSGTIAGSVSLTSSRFDTANRFSAHVGYGSFNRLSYGLNATVLARSTAIKAVVFGRNAQNNYPYEDLRGEVRNLHHAQFVTNGFIYQQRFFFKRSNPLTIRVWNQATHREIPPTLVEAQSQKYQQDRSTRIQSDWSAVFGKKRLKLNAGHFTEDLNYQDSLSNIYGEYRFYNTTFIAQILHLESRNFSYGIDLEARDFRGVSDTFYKKDRQEFAQALHLSFKRGKSHVQSSVRLVQYSTTDDRPLLLSVNYTYRLKRGLRILTLLSTNYRMPTFNNLYWRPGGNPDLVSERSTNSELTCLASRKKLRGRVTLFSNFIEDQIRWLPGGNGYFEAQQVVGQTQWNRGLEAGLTWRKKKIDAFVNTSVLRSTKLQDNSPFTGNQQTYIPHLQGNSGVGYRFGSLKAAYQTWFVGRRYTDAENTEYLPGLIIHTVKLSYEKGRIQATGSIANLGNLYYTLMPYTPNIPRNFNLKFSYTFIKNKEQ